LRWGRTFFDLVSAQLGGIGFDGESIIYGFKSRRPPTLVRAPFTRIFPRRSSRGAATSLTAG
jgi:hypothetical protein